MELGPEQDARAEAAEVLRLAPKFSLEEFRKRIPISDHFVDVLRRAGLK